MKLLYACADSANDPLLWSGIVANCKKALQSAGIELVVMDQIPFDCPPHLRILHQWHKRFGKKTHLIQIEPAILRRAARRVAARFARGDCDAVFSPGTGVPVYAYLPDSVPTFSYLDATKLSWIRAYFGESTLCARSQQHMRQVDRTSLTHNTLTFFASQWARTEAAQDYEIPINRMAVVPFGANLVHPPTRAEVEGWIAERPRTPIRLLLLGKEWERKGGPEALALVRELLARGQPATLDVVGCSPKIDSNDQAFTRVHGFVDHSLPEGRKLLHGLLRETHVLLFLSRAEAFGIAVCETAAFGVPAYAANVGGIPTIVRHGVNGWLGETPYSPISAASALLATWRHQGEYARIALGARVDYENRLNWEAAGRALKDYMERALLLRKAR
jgi:glycosyltransferase involved in cell wall biosynthesis